MRVYEINLMKNKQPMIQIVLIVLLGLGVSSNPLHDHPPRLSTKVLTVSNGGQYGSWGPFCGKGAYAVGYAVGYDMICKNVFYV